MASKLIFLGLKISNDLYRQLKARAKQRKVSVSELCREHLESSLSGTSTSGDGDLRLTKADLEGLLTKTDLRALERLFFSVIVSEKLLLKTGNNSKQLLTEVANDAQRVTDGLYAKLDTKKAEAKTS